MSRWGWVGGGGTEAVIGCWSCSACLARQLGRKGCAGSDVEGAAGLQWSEEEAAARIGWHGAGSRHLLQLVQGMLVWVV